MILNMAAAFAAGETKSFMLQADRFELLDVPYTVDVELVDRNGGKLAAMSGGETSWFMEPRNGPFYEIRITSQQAQTVRWFVGSGDAGTRKTAGVVQVVDGGKARTLADQAFAWANGALAVAAKFGMCQLFNPAGSGKRVIVKAYQVTMQAAGNVRVFTNNAAATTLEAAPVNSKHHGGAAPVAQSRSDNLVASTPTPAYLDSVSFAAAGSTPRIVLQEPVVLEPGRGFCVETTSPAVQVNATYEWLEEII